MPEDNPPTNNPPHRGSELKIRIARDHHFHWGHALHIYHRPRNQPRHDGMVYIAKPLVFEPLDTNQVIVGDRREPTLMIDDDNNETLQALMDNLWELGIRPRDIGTAGHLAATQHHLADMRALVAHASGAKLP